MTQQKWRISELPGEERRMVEALYGAQYSPKKILYVRKLTEYEKSMFASRNFMSSNFLTHTLYKFRGLLIPLHFNRILWQMVVRSDVLRTNYYRGTKDAMAVVFEERKILPEVSYRNVESVDPENLESTLKNLMESDMRESLDLQRGNLIRFSIYRTSRDEYAVLVTMAQIIADRVDVRDIFREVAGIEPEERRMPPVDAGLKASPMDNSLRDYWGKVLAGLPPAPAVPGTMGMRNFPPRQRAYRKRIPPDIMSNLRELAKSNKMMLMTMLQTAWGFLLQEFNDCRDVCFCLLVPERRGKGTETGGLFRMMPVRLRSADEISVKNLVGQQFQQMIVSQPYSSFDWEGLQEIAGNAKDMFNHFLSFSDFLLEEQSYSEVKASPEGAVVLRNSWDARGTRLGIYFRYEEKGVSYTIMYDENRFGNLGGTLLSRRYMRVIQRMITDWNVSFSEFMQQLRQRLDADQRLEAEYQQEDGVAHIQDALSRIQLFHGGSTGIIQPFTKVAKLETRFEGDRISGAEIEDNFVFISRGRIARNVDSGDGWYNVLDVLKDGAWINETVLLSQRKYSVSAEVLTEEAEILLIPRSSMREFLKTIPSLSENVLQHILGQMERYQHLWMQS